MGRRLKGAVPLSTLCALLVAAELRRSLVDLKQRARLLVTRNVDTSELLTFVLQFIVYFVRMHGTNGTNMVLEHTIFRFAKFHLHHVIANKQT